MRLKLRRLRDRLEHSLANQYPDGVELICPDGTISLAEDTNIDEGDDYHAALTPTKTKDLKHMNLCAWWRNLDTVNRYEGLAQSLDVLAAMLRKDPVDGIIGFSQGATLATMLVSLCEGNPARTTALAEQGEPCHLAPPQSPFKFALLSCGYKGTDKYYNGFYAPRLTTPILFDTATLDHMVAPALTEAWVAVGSSNCEVVSRLGGHWFPNDNKTTLAMASFATKNCLAASERISAAWSSSRPASFAASGVRIRYGLSKKTGRKPRGRIGIELRNTHPEQAVACKRGWIPRSPAAVSASGPRPVLDGVRVCVCGALA